MVPFLPKKRHTRQVIQGIAPEIGGKRKEREMSKVKRKPIFWVGIACIVIGIILAVLIGIGIIPLTRLDQNIAEVFSLCGSVLVVISYFGGRKSA